MKPNDSWSFRLTFEIKVYRIPHIDSQFFKGIGLGRDAVTEYGSNISAVFFLSHLEDHFFHESRIREISTATKDKPAIVSYLWSAFSLD